MEAVLSEAWLRGLDAAPVRDDAGVALFRARVRDVGERAGVGREALEGLVTAASELGHNALRHGRDGWAAARAVERAGVPGAEVVVADRGRGMQDPRRALQGGAPPTGEARAASLGAGLSGARRLTEEMDIDARRGEGTCVRVRRFARPLAVFTEVGIFGRPADGEVVSGDDAAAVFLADAIFLAAADGLGHGPEARVASARALETLQAVLGKGERDPGQVLRACDGALEGTRGGVMAVARLPVASTGGACDGRGLPSPCDVVHAAAGNVTALLHEGLARARGFVSTPRVLGRDGRTEWRPRVETVVPGGGDAVLLLFTDGLSGRATLEGEPALLRQHPVVIAQALLERFGQAHDDALVVVCRRRQGLPIDRA